MGANRTIGVRDPETAASRSPSVGVLATAIDGEVQLAIEGALVFGSTSRLAGRNNRIQQPGQRACRRRSSRPQPFRLAYDVIDGMGAKRGQQFADIRSDRPEVSLHHPRFSGEAGA